MRMNYRPDQGLRNCQWPGDQFLHPVGKDTWVDQANTCWTGVELAFVALLYRTGRVEDAETIIKNVDDRYRRLGMYFDHQEFGGHYFRPMSALSIPNAYLGASYSEGILTIDPAHDLPKGRWAILLPGGCISLCKSADGYTTKVSFGSVSLNGLIIKSNGHPVATVEYDGKRGRLFLHPLTCAGANHPIQLHGPARHAALAGVLPARPAKWRLLEQLLAAGGKAARRLPDNLQNGDRVRHGR